ncbi:hypothetical protein SmJEL517_g01184 [Synchytrium microbalum]|uniref:Cytochrome b5 heme-binding domain-containing protein n=1 Tax=Synchytrium microbalum TaxID=1806994 RepID=A0A507C659_9FUNG|nr:uncharacterized protein SmJEL517_g01184 [Synchytrium microbalum]TPX36517.1 hypothetical protein SmJEL517_g01184 [Synchytrium microbalum]
MVASKDINWLNVAILTVPPLAAIYGIATTQARLETLLWAVAYYFWTGLSITAGYHRYWSHRSYDCSFPMKVFLALGGAGAMEGSIRWWSRGHRAHHRYTDSPKDPYDSSRGLLYSHIGWMVIKEDPSKMGRVDISDLNRDELVMWQHKNYLWLGPLMAFLFPAIVAYIGWGDFWGGLFFAGMARLVFVHHATFCVNSLAHYLGEASYDDRRTPRDHFITALVTLGEGYHNFHHEFPSDYRNAVFFWQYDPTKWLIFIASLVGLTYNLKMFPENEVAKGRIQMQEKKIAELKQKLNWGKPLEQLPEWEWTKFVSACEKDKKQYLVVDKVVYDCDGFMDEHPGGRGFLKTSIGRDVSASFNGAIYFHSNAARNLATQMRVAKIVGEIPENDKAKEE